jgi:hypothetical protein
MSKSSDQLRRQPLLRPQGQAQLQRRFQPLARGLRPLSPSRPRQAERTGSRLSLSGNGRCLSTGSIDDDEAERRVVAHAGTFVFGATRTVLDPPPPPFDRSTIPPTDIRCGLIFRPHTTFFTPETYLRSHGIRTIIVAPFPYSQVHFSTWKLTRLPFPQGSKRLML